MITSGSTLHTVWWAHVLVEAPMHPCAIHGSLYTLYASSRYVVCSGTCTDDAMYHISLILVAMEWLGIREAHYLLCSVDTTSYPRMGCTPLLLVAGVVAIRGKYVMYTIMEVPCTVRNARRA
jgi:hypothetical protein